MEGQLSEILRQKIIDGLATQPPPFTRRDVRIPQIKGKAVAVIGMRRTGKTTFLWQLLADRLSAGTPREDLLYFNFEDERLGDLRARNMGMIVEEYYSLHPEGRDTRRATFFFDEIQVVPGWEVFARRLLDTERVDLFLSGSSALLLSREVATSMRGRAVEAMVHPLSFREYLRHLHREPGHPPLAITKAARSLLERDLRNYLQTGGFPESLGLGLRDHHELLDGYVDSVLLRDVIERHKVSHPIALRWMVRHLLGNAGGFFTVNKFCGDLRSQGIPVAKGTIHEYLAHLEDAFLIRTVSLATNSERQRMVNPRKVFPIDPGLIPIFDQSGKPNTGHALETCVLLHLDRAGAQTSWVKTPDGFEVDFLAVHPGSRKELIQICTNVEDGKTREREIRSLLNAKKNNPGVSLHLITLDPWPSETPLPKNIHHHLASDWLLA